MYLRPCFYAPSTMATSLFVAGPLRLVLASDAPRDYPRRMAIHLVTVSELEQRLSHHLRRVRAGATLLVSHRGRVIARLEPADNRDAAVDDVDWIAELERRGTLRRPTARLPRTWLARRPQVRANVARALLDERDEGR